MIAVGSGGGNLINVPLFHLSLVFILVLIDFVCLFVCFIVVCLKSSLGRGPIGSSYLLALTTLLVPNAEQEINLHFVYFCLCCLCFHFVSIGMFINCFVLSLLEPLFSFSFSIPLFSYVC